MLNIFCVWQGEGADLIPCDETNLVCTGLAYAFKAAGQEVPTLKFHLKNRIPFCRGMGSSSAAIVAGLVAGLVLSGADVVSSTFIPDFNVVCQVHTINQCPSVRPSVTFQSLWVQNP